MTILGHVQRGGTPSAYDRILGARMGCEAVLALMMHAANYRPVVIGINGNQTSYICMEESVERTRAIGAAIRDRDFAKAVELRGPSFKRNLETYLRMSKLEPPSNTSIHALNMPSTLKDVQKLLFLKSKAPKSLKSKKKPLDNIGKSGNERIGWKPGGVKTRRQQVVQIRYT